MAQDLEARFPGRSKQIATLIRLMGKPSDPVVSSIFIYGHPSSGKTSVVRSLMEATLPRPMWAYINCVECHTQRMLFEHALNQWCNWTPSWENQFTAVCRVDNIHQFVRVLKETFAGEEGRNGETRYLVNNAAHGGRFFAMKTKWFILDRAERLRDLSPTLLAVLLRLSEMSGLNLCVILLSNVVFEKFRIKGGAYEPVFIYFPEYTKEDTLRILQLDFKAEQTVRVLGADDDEESIVLDHAFYASFVELIYSIFNHNCKDINELRYIAALLFPLYIKPLRERLAQKHETAKLFRFAQPYFAEATYKLYLREISSAEWSKETARLEKEAEEELEEDEEAGVDASAQRPKPKPFLSTGRSGGKGDFDLPYYTKFLLMASYLASYNPPKYDVRYFAKVGEERRKKKGGGTRKAKADTSAKMSQQLLGPKAFPVERMLAIFYSIIDEDLEDTIDIQTQITSLTTLRLLVRANAMDRLDAAKFKCNVSFEFIRAVAKSVRFEIEKYLFT